MLLNKLKNVDEDETVVYSSSMEKLYVTFNAMNNCDILKECVYRGEGNSNVVISLPNTRQILRIKKTDKTKSYFEHCIESLMQYVQTESCDINLNKRVLSKSLAHKLKSILGNILDWCFHIFDIEYSNIIYNAELSLIFYKKIMMPLLGEVYTSEAKSINLSKREITILEKEINKLRPGK